MIPARLRFEVLERDEFACQYCGAKAPDVTLHVDHVVPASAGGPDVAENLITACRDCNMGKANVGLRFVPDHILARAGNAYERGAAMRDSVAAAHQPERLVPVVPVAADASVLAAIRSEGEAVKASIAAAQLRQAYVASALGFSEAHLSRIIHGHRIFPTHLVSAFCSITGSTLLAQYIAANREKTDADRLAEIMRGSAA